MKSNRRSRRAKKANVNGVGNGCNQQMSWQESEADNKNRFVQLREKRERRVQGFMLLLSWYDNASYTEFVYIFSRDSAPDASLLRQTGAE